MLTDGLYNKVASGPFCNIPATAKVEEKTDRDITTQPNFLSIVYKYIDKKGEGMHHIAFAVTDIYAEMERLKSEGFILLNETPKNGADNKLVCFLHPKNTNGVLIELCQDKK